MADVSRPHHNAVFAELSRVTGQPIRVVEDGDWQERMALIDNGQVDLAFLCGLPFATRRAFLTVVAAPVMAGARYGGQPNYFSDVITGVDSGVKEFADLKGRRWAYNEPDSHSGHNCVRFHLAGRDTDFSFFGEVVESGSHARSIRLVEAGTVDGAAIDTTVLEMELARRPDLSERIRVVDTIGPSPIPPLAANRRVETIADIRRAALSLHESPQGRAALRLGNVDRFVQVEDSYYDTVIFTEP